MKRSQTLFSTSGSSASSKCVPARRSSVCLFPPNSVVTGGVVTKVDPSSTGLNPAWRKALVHTVFGRIWPDGSSASTINKVREDVKRIEGTLRDLAPESGAYFNEARTSATGIAIVLNDHTLGFIVPSRLQARILRCPLRQVAEDQEDLRPNRSFPRTCWCWFGRMGRRPSLPSLRRSINKRCTSCRRRDTVSTLPGTTGTTNYFKYMYEYVCKGGCLYKRNNTEKERIG